MGDKDEILMNFQAITGIDDIAICLDILEQKNWDLVAALSGVMPPENYSQSVERTSNGPSTNSSNGPVRSVGYVDLTVPETHINVEAEESTVQQATGSSTSCTLGVYFGEKLLRLELPLSTTLAEVKQQLERETRVPPSEQVLSGWPQAMQVPKEVEEQMTLEQLNISGDIYHIRMDHQPPFHYPSLPHLQTLTDISLSNNSMYVNKSSVPTLTSSLFNHRQPSFPVQETAQSDVRSLSVDPGSLEDQLSSQESTDGVSGGEGVVAGEGGKKKGEHSRGTGDSLIVIGSTTAKVPALLKPNEVIEIRDSSHSSGASDSSPIPDCFGEDDELFDDEDVKSTSAIKALKDPLVPEDCTEPYEVLQCFTHSFELRYGAMHPLFLLGSLAEAMAEATSGPASSRVRKPMFVYLHHDRSVLSNVFCSQLLCSESVVSYLSLNFITWAWDLTLHIHRLKLLKMVEDCFGSAAKTSVDEIKADHLPVILIVYKEKGSVSIRNIIQGETNLDSLMTSLLFAVEEHNMVIEREILEEHERLVREHMIAEQNQAYEESLQADREKERKKKEQEEEEEKERLSKEAERQAMGQSVPEEPPESSQEKLCTLRIRFPDGEVGQRRFLASNTLQDVINFVGSNNYMVSEYKILTGFPRKDLTEQNFALSLDELKLCPQETLFIEERT